MSALQSNARVLVTLVRREISEQRLLFLYLPLACALAAMLFYTLWLMNPPADSRVPPRVAFLIGDSSAGDTREGYAFAISAMYHMSVQAMQVVFWMSMAFYFLSTLYRQRRDRSILFWNSMPVSSTQSVVSKLLAGLVGCHLVYLLCFVLLNVFMNLASAASSGLFRMDGWQALFILFTERSWSMVLGYLREAPWTMLWSLPVSAWLLLASAWSPRAPLAWALGPWLVLVLAEFALSDSSLLFNTLIAHLVPVREWQTAGSAYGVELGLCVTLGVALLVAAARLNRSDDT